MLSSKAKYALKALFFMAGSSVKGPFQVSELARREGIPRKFLEAIMADLMHAGLVFGKRGMGGGYFLNRAVEDISVGEVIRVIDGPLAPISCVSKTAYSPCEDCPTEATCGVHLIMTKVRDGMAKLLDQTSVAKVATQMAAAKEASGEALMYHI